MTKDKKSEPTIVAGERFDLDLDGVQSYIRLRDCSATPDEHE